MYSPILHQVALILGRPSGLLHVAMKRRPYHYPCGAPGASGRLALLRSRGWSLRRPAGTGLVQDWLGELSPEFTRFFDAHCWAKGPNQLTQKSDDQWIGVRPGLAAVKFISAMLTTPVLTGLRLSYARKPRRQAPCARSDLCGPPGGGDDVTQRGEKRLQAA